jgi:ubiquinone/menaquinone biosynthesis C-methylase UbiE
VVLIEHFFKAEKHREYARGVKGEVAVGKGLLFNRKYTTKVNWMLDNVVPPVLRDSRLFMWPLFRILFGSRMYQFMSFKQKARTMTEEEYVRTYNLLACVHIERETDLNDACIRRILEALVGTEVLDVACGRGYLARRIAEDKRVRVVGIDIAPPEEGSNERIRFIRGAVEKIPFPDRYFDTVVSTHTLEHVRNLPAVVDELRRVAKKRLIVVVPKQREYKYTFDLHLNFFPYEYCLRQAMKNEKAVISLEGGDFIYVEDMGLR